MWSICTTIKESRVTMFCRVYRNLGCDLFEAIARRAWDRRDPMGTVNFDREQHISSLCPQPVLQRSWTDRKLNVRMNRVVRDDSFWWLGFNETLRNRKKEWRDQKWINSTFLLSVSRHNCGLVRRSRNKVLENITSKYSFAFSTASTAPRTYVHFVKYSFANDQNFFEWIEGREESWEK